MARTAHTPGPWAVGFSDGTGQSYITAGDHPALKRADESVVVVVRGGEDDWGIERGVQNPADALLIAAAPDILEACRSLLRMHDEGASLVGLVGPILRDARAAVAKATGAQA